MPAPARGCWGREHLITGSAHRVSDLAPGPPIPGPGRDPGRPKRGGSWARPWSKVGRWGGGEPCPSVPSVPGAHPAGKPWCRSCSRRPAQNSLPSGQGCPGRSASARNRLGPEARRRRAPGARGPGRAERTGARGPGRRPGCRAGPDRRGRDCRGSRRLGGAPTGRLRTAPARAPRSSPWPSPGPASRDAPTRLQPWGRMVVGPVVLGGVDLPQHSSRLLPSTEAEAEEAQVVPDLTFCPGGLCASPSLPHLLTPLTSPSLSFLIYYPVISLILRTGLL